MQTGGYQLIRITFILSGMSEIYPADGDMLVCWQTLTADQLPSAELITVGILHFNEKKQNVSEDTSL